MNTQTHIFLSVYFTSLFLDAQTEVPAMKLRTPTCSSPTCPRPWMRNSWRACSLRMEKSSVRRSSSIIKLVSPKGAVSFSSQKPPRLIGLYPVSNLISSLIRVFFFQNSSRKIIILWFGVIIFTLYCTVLVLSFYHLMSELNGSMAPGSTNLMTVKKAQDSEQTKAMKHGQIQVIHHYSSYPGAGQLTNMRLSLAICVA